MWLGNGIFVRLVFLISLVFLWSARSLVESKALWKLQEQLQNQVTARPSTKVEAATFVKDFRFIDTGSSNQAKCLYRYKVNNVVVYVGQAFDQNCKARAGQHNTEMREGLMILASGVYDIGGSVYTAMEAFMKMSTELNRKIPSEWCIVLESFKAGMNFVYEEMLANAGLTAPETDEGEAFQIHALNPLCNVQRPQAPANMPARWTGVWNNIAVNDALRVPKRIFFLTTSAAVDRKLSDNSEANIVNFN